MAYNWKEINNRCKSIKVSTLTGLAKVLDIPKSTLWDALQRGDISYVFKEPSSDSSKITLKASMDTYPTKKDLGDLFDIDFNEYEIVSEKITANRHDNKTKSMPNYSIELSLMPVFLSNRAIVKPIEVLPINNTKSSEKSKNEGFKTVLFTSDWHIGFNKSSNYVNLLNYPIHNRIFIAGILSVVKTHTPDLIILGGDILDFEEFSTFNNGPTNPDYLQMSLLETNFIIQQLMSNSNGLVYLEGNHEKRLKSFLNRKAPELLNFVDVHSLIGIPDLNYLGDYPNNEYILGDAKFYHGDTVKSGSGKTVSFIVDSACVNHFFGHIHRYELVKKFVPDLQKDIYVGCPGCACFQEDTPGSKYNDNWSQGAFFITFDDSDKVISVEHITQLSTNTLFRGKFYTYRDYKQDLLNWLPLDYKGLF